MFSNHETQSSNNNISNLYTVWSAKGKRKLVPRYLAISLCVFYLAYVRCYPFAGVNYDAVTQYLQSLLFYLVVAESVEAEPSKPGGWQGLLELFSGESDEATRHEKSIPVLRELIKIFSALKKIPKVNLPTPRLFAQPTQGIPKLFVNACGCRCETTGNSLLLACVIPNNGTKPRKF